MTRLNDIIILSGWGGGSKVTLVKFSFLILLLCPSVSFSDSLNLAN